MGDVRQGRWMLKGARSAVGSRSTSVRRDLTWLARVPAPNRAMDTPPTEIVGLAYSSSALNSASAASE